MFVVWSLPTKFFSRLCNEIPTRMPSSHPVAIIFSQLNSPKKILFHGRLPIHRMDIHIIVKCHTGVGNALLFPEFR